MHSVLSATCVVPAPDDGEPDWERLPASRGVVVFENDAGETSLIATSANVRALARRRLDPANAGTRHADLRAITSLVRAAPTGSAFESDLIYLELARERLPHVYGAVTDRWQGWFVEVEPDAAFPRFAKAPTTAMAARPGLRYFGPVADKHAGARFVELVEDLFDLCRYHHILVQAPSASACVYKEMGKCPAPCDGSESMDAYRARLAQGVRFAADPPEGVREAEAEMREASAVLDFERAEERRRWIKRATEATKKKFREMAALDSFRFIVVAPSVRPGWACLIAVAGGRWSILMDVRRNGPLEGVRHACEHAIDALGPCGFSRPELDRLGLVCTWLARSEKMRRGVRFVRLDEGCEEALIESIRKDASDKDESEDPTQEIGAEGGEETHQP